MNTALHDLEQYFDQINATPVDWPAFFAFFVPGEAAVRKWSHYPKAAFPSAGRAAGGRGLTREQCRLSGLGEAIEIASCCDWGDEILEYANARKLGSAAIAPSRLTGLSQLQEMERDSWNAAFGRLDWRVRTVAKDESIAWVRGRDAISGDVRLIPADAVLIGRRSAEDEDAACIADTSGCAANATRETAELSALLELIERDAIGRWWYGARKRPVLPLDILNCESSLLRFLNKRPRETTIFDITTDLAIPTVAAVSRNVDGTAVSMGFSCKPSHVAAMVHALVEMLQGEISLVQRAKAKDPLLSNWLKTVTMELPALTVSKIEADPVTLHDNSPAAVIELCLDRLNRAGCSVAFFDHTRPEFGIPVIRAISAELCRDKPRWAYKRLLAHDPNDLGQSPQPDNKGDPPNAFPLMI